MKIPKPPRDRGHNNYYGGVGTKPAPRAWTPGSKRGHGDDDPVPRRLRKVHLQRHHRASTSDTESPLVATLIIVIIAAVAVAAVALFSRLAS